MRPSLRCLAFSMVLPTVLASYAAAAAPEVSVSRPVAREITDEEHFTGRTEASKTVEIRSRLTSYLDSVLFKDGAEVAKGQVLFQLDDRLSRADVERAQAEVAKTDAAL